MRDTGSMTDLSPENLIKGKVYDLCYCGVTRGDNTYLIRGTFMGLDLMYDNRRAKGATSRVKRLTVLFTIETEEFTRCISWWRVISFKEVE